MYSNFSVCLGKLNKKEKFFLNLIRVSGINSIKVTSLKH